MKNTLMSNYCKNLKELVKKLMNIYERTNITKYSFLPVTCFFASHKNCIFLSIIKSICCYYQCKHSYNIKKKILLLDKFFINNDKLKENNI